MQHGHDKDKILREYSREELSLFYEKCIKQEMRQQAGFAEMVALGIGAAFGGGKKIDKVLKQMKE